MRPGARAFALASLLAAAAPACYAPDIDSGTLRCGPASSCPAGYKCLAADKTCWKDGEVPATTPRGGVAPAFEGHYLFAKPASNTTACSDGSRQTRTLENDYVDVLPGGAGDIVASYYCDWELNVAANGVTATLRPGMTCPGVATEPTMGRVKTEYTWSASSFTFVKTGAKAAVLNAEVSGTYRNVLTCVTPTTCVPCTTNCTGMCTITMSGPLTKTD